MRKQKVTYLFGAGSTQGEIAFFDKSFSLLTKDIVQGIITKIDESKIKILKEVKNELTIKSDVEHLITLYENIGTAKHLKVAKKLKELFRQEILDKLTLIKKNNESFFPVLSSALIDMYNVKKINEELCGIITVNYDDLIEQAAQNVEDEFHYSIETKIKKAQYRISTTLSSFPILKLHGSFNWKKDYPVIVTDQYNLKENDVLWIPPGLDKRREQYPFSLLWAKAKEILKCDILRIIGCSLNRNDIQLISLIFSMQKINSAKKFKIEIIDFHDVGNYIRKNYPYLNVETILEISECREYLIDYSGIPPSEELPSTVIDIVRNSNSKTNIFEWWLRAKGNQLKKDKRIKSVVTNRHYFENFINQRS
jgi:hypothetical protein